MGVILIDSCKGMGVNYGKMVLWMLFGCRGDLQVNEEDSLWIDLWTICKPSVRHPI